MATDTLLEKSWIALDFLGSDNQRKNQESEEIIIESIKTDITKSVFNINRCYSYYESGIKATLREEEKEEVHFETPKINNDFLIYDTKYFRKSQKWIGHVEEVHKDVFVAKLTDLDNPTTYEVGEFDYEEISPEDRELVTKGAAFYWTLGRSNYNGQVKKESLIRFQRVRLWTEEQFDKVADSANDIYETLKWE
jgi:hypothetical protein